MKNSLLRVFSLLMIIGFSIAGSVGPSWKPTPQDMPNERKPAESVTAKREQSVIEIPAGSVGIVAYGSLMSLVSMEQTLGHKYSGPVHPIRLRGYERAWTNLSALPDPPTTTPGMKTPKIFFRRGQERIPLRGFVQLNVHPKPGGRINGVLYLITDNELMKLDKREYGYRRVDVSDKIEEFSFAGGKVYIYEGLPEFAERAAPDGAYVLVQEFFDSVTGACDSLGRGFREEFDKTTKPTSYPVVPIKDLIQGEAR